MLTQNSSVQQHVLPSLSLDWLAYENNKYQIKVKYPTIWHYQTKDNPLSSFIIFSPKNNSKSKAKVSISVENLSDLISLKEYTTQFKKEIREHNQKCHIIKIKDFILIKAASYKITYKFERDNQKLKKMAAIALKDKKAYIIYYEAEINHFAEFESIAEEMFNSLELL